MHIDGPKSTNWFVRILIVIFCALLSAMIAYRYLAIEPRGEISTGVITLLGIILILVLSESFDNFSVGKIIQVSREVRKKEKEVEKLEKQNESLFAQLISISNIQTQNQSHTNVYGDYHAAPTVEKASEQEVSENKSAESPQAPQPSSGNKPRIDWGQAEALGFTKYLSLRALHSSNVITNAKLVTEFQGIDPISTMQPVFDGYLKNSDHETFIELRPTKFMTPQFRDRLYLMLSKINHYRTAKRIEAHLDLVLLKIPGEEESRIHGSSSRFIESFEPAIASGLLKIHEIAFTEEEANSLRSESF